jgi:hypothetical protein
MVSFDSAKQISANAMTIAQLVSIASILPSDASALQSAISALERDIAALDKSSSWWEPWPFVFTFLVAVGVALEIVVVLRDRKEELEEWQICVLHPERPSSSKVWLEIASVVLVTVGILGELGVGIWISRINGQLRSKNSELRSDSDQLLALTTQEAGNAEKSAEGAAIAAHKAGLSADAAQQTLKVVGQEVEALSPRIVKPDQQLKIIEALKNVHGSHPTIIGSYGMDGEGTALAGQLIEIFHAAKIPVGDQRAGQIVTGGFEWGISIRGPTREMPFMTALRHALRVAAKLDKVSINGPSPAIGVMTDNEHVVGSTGANAERPRSRVHVALRTDKVDWDCVFHEQVFVFAIVDSRPYVERIGGGNIVMS